MEISSSPLGYTVGINHFSVDPVVMAIAQGLVPDPFLSQLADLGHLVGNHVVPVGNEIDHQPPIELISHDIDGRRVDQARLTQAHRSTYELLRPVIATPQTSAGFAGHFLEGYLIADPGFYCLITLSTQVATALHLLHPSPEDLLRRLTQGSSWGGTWFTEIHAGSDLGANRTRAISEAAGWSLSSGDKYFASGAGMTDLALVSAYPENAISLRDLHLFLVERYAQDQELNFIVRRLKSKLGTRAIPTGEVELDRSHAVLLAGANDGIYRILQSLTLARTANAVASAGVARIAILEATLRGDRRSAFGTSLAQHPLFARDLVTMRLAHLGITALALLCAETFASNYDFVDHNDSEYLVLRLLSHATKTHTATTSIAITKQALECFGGLGFLEDYAIARWHREALVLPIWEGSTNIHALDAAEVARHPEAAQGICDLIQQWVPDSLRPAVVAQADKALHDLKGEAWYAKEALAELGHCLEIAALGRFATFVPELADVANLRWRYHATGTLPIWHLPESLQFRVT